MVVVKVYLRNAAYMWRRTYLFIVFWQKMKSEKNIFYHFLVIILICACCDIRLISVRDVTYAAEVLLKQRRPSLSQAVSKR